MSVAQQQAKHYAAVHQRLMGPEPPRARSPRPKWHQPTVKPLLVEPISKPKPNWNTPHVWEIIRDFPALDERRPSVIEIAKDVCWSNGITLTELYSAGRQKALTSIRHQFFYRAACETMASLPAIGRRCGGRDHTTVMYGIAKYAVDHDVPLPRKMKPTHFDFLKARRRKA